MEADTPEYWEYRIGKWKGIKERIIQFFGKKYYLDHLKRFEKYLEESRGK